MKVRTTGLTIAALLFAWSAGAQAHLPEGWRPATSAEFRNAKPKELVASGDFDADGKVDKAMLLVDKAGRRGGLFVFMRSSSKWLEVDSSEISGWLGSRIATVKPGRYETACGKGYGDYACANGEPKVLVLKRAAIDLYVPGSSDLFFYWDRRLQLFNKTLITD